MATPRPHSRLPLSADASEAVAQLIAERERIRGMLTTERAASLTLALMEAYVAAAKANAALRDQRSLVRMRLDASKNTLEGVRDADTRLHAALTGEIQRATSHRQAAGFAVGEVARRTLNDAFSAWFLSELLLRAEALIAHSLETRLEPDAQAELVAALKWLAQPMWALAQRLSSGREAVADHIATLPRARSSNTVSEWLKSIARQAGSEDEVWIAAAVAAIQHGFVPRPLNGSPSSDASIRVTSKAAKRLLHAIRPTIDAPQQGEITVSEDLLARSAEPSWILLLPLIDAPLHDSAALWRAFLESSAAAMSPLRAAIDRLILDEANRRTAELEQERDALRRDITYLTELNESAQSRSSELEAGLADARAQIAGSASPRLPVDALEAAAELLNELRRNAEIPDRTAHAADRLRKAAGLEAIATIDDAADDILPELFDFVGQPGGGATASVLRPAWVAADAAGEMTLVSKGAIKFG
jgi:hypothetical protein